ncbi:MAG: hypothetical protein R3321_11300 [Nitrososphaeraceae archaeon]|nr:hypothetical protein [Nitrososphaeraceae archaeon]
MKGLTSNTYLTRNLLNKVFNKKLSLNEIDEMVLNGKLLKHYSYYKPSEELLRELKIIPNKVKISDVFFGRIAKTNAFVLKEIQMIFNDCSLDTAKILARKYFYKKHNYWYKNDLLIELLTDGIQEYEV